MNKYGIINTIGLALILFAKSNLAAPCFSTQYPRILVGTSGTTTFHAIDLEPLQKLDLVIGGETSDAGIIGTLFAAPDPIILYMVNGGLYKWGFGFRGVDLDRVNSVRFNPLGTKIHALVVNSLTWYLALIQPSDGTLLKVIKDGDNRPGIYLKSGGHMLVDSADNVYLGYLGVKTGSSPLVNLWQLFKINTASTALTFTASLSLANEKKDASTRANIYDIIFSADTSIILIAAALVKD